MKKILLASTMLVGAAALAGPAMAQTNNAVSNAPFTVKISGYDNATFAVVKESRDSNQRSYDFRNQMRIQIVGEAKADNGLVYGINARLNIGTAGSTGSQNAVTVDRSYGYASGSFGTVRAGEHDTIAHDWFGWQSDGKYAGFGIATGDTFGPGGGLGSETPLTNGQVANLENLADHFGLETFSSGRGYTKLSYYSPKFSGFQAAVSYAPDNNGRRSFDRNDKYDAAITGGALSFGNNYKNLVEIAVKYEQTFDNLYVWLGGGADFAQAKDPLAAAVGAAATLQPGGSANRKLNDVAEGGVRGIVNYMGFGFQGALNYGGTSGYAKRASTDLVYDSKNAMGGFVDFSYHFGPYTVDVNYAAARGPGSVLVNGKETYSAVQLGGSYVPAPGLILSAGLTFYDAKTDGTYVAGSANGTNNKNKATVFEIATQVIF